MIKAFLDASVVFSAVVSESGASRELLKRHIRHEVTLVVSEYILNETVKNLLKKVPNKAGSVSLLVDLMEFEVVTVTVENIKAVAKYTEPKDAPVVAAAIASQCKYLVTFDRQHLLGNQQVVRHSGLIIATAGDLLQKLDES